jgi:serpin B
MKHVFNKPLLKVVRHRKGALRIFALSLFFLFSFYGCDSNNAILTSPDYPQKTVYKNSVGHQTEAQTAGFIRNLQSFSYESASTVLSDHSTENSLYSPLSLFFSLVISAAGSNGETQQEMLHALSMNDFSTEQLIGQAAILFRNQYFDNNIGQTKLANSLWIKKGFPVNRTFLSEMADNLYLTSGQVDFSSTSAEKLINQWVSENTRGIDRNIVIDKNQDVAMILINTILFSDEWLKGFDSSKTETGDFSLSNGNMVQAEFINIRLVQKFIRRDGFTSSYLPFKNGYNMVLILPDEGVLADSILADPARMEEAAAICDSKEGIKGRIAFKIPKFDFNSDFRLRETLHDLGIKTAFDSEKADFSNITDKILFMSDVLQSSSITLDENGCVASAYTETVYSTSSWTDEQVDEQIFMFLDRPFVFMITGMDNVPLFIGKVGNPAAH